MFASFIDTAFLACVGASDAAFCKTEVHSAEIGRAQPGNSSYSPAPQGLYLDLYFSALTKAMSVMQKEPSPLTSDIMNACQEVIRSRSAPSDASCAEVGSDARIILDAWFNEHFENPYPTREEKKELMNLCGIRVNQVNNYFGNRRKCVKQEIFRAARRGETVFFSHRSTQWLDIESSDEEDN